MADAEQINQNQRLLISAFNEFKKNQINRPIIMEAHATIYNDFELVDVPIDIIEELAPTHLVLLEASEQDILKRRRSDVRKRPIRSISEIRNELARERHAVTAYAAILQIPLTIANATEIFTLDDIIS